MYQTSREPPISRTGVLRMHKLNGLRLLLHTSHRDVSPVPSMKHQSLIRPCIHAPCVATPAADDAGKHRLCTSAGRRPLWCDGNGVRLLALHIAVALITAVAPSQSLIAGSNIAAMFFTGQPGTLAFDFAGIARSPTAPTFFLNNSTVPLWEVDCLSGTGTNYAGPITITAADQAPSTVQFTATAASATWINIPVPGSSSSLLTVHVTAAVASSGTDIVWGLSLSWNAAANYGADTVRFPQLGIAPYPSPQSDYDRLVIPVGCGYGMVDPTEYLFSPSCTVPMPGGWIDLPYPGVCSMQFSGIYNEQTRETLYLAAHDPSLYTKALGLGRPPAGLFMPELRWRIATCHHSKSVAPMPLPIPSSCRHFNR